MQIAVGVHSVEEIEQLVIAGATEFYAGIVPKAWSKKYGYSVSPNRREFKSPNITSYVAYKKIIEQAHLFGKKIYLTINAHEYSSAALSEVRKIVKKLDATGVDGFIVADMGLLLMFSEWGISSKISLSGDFGITNSRSLALAARTGLISRVIFPRHLSLEDMSRLIRQFPDFEYEAFIMNERCFYSGAFCYSAHGRSPQNYCTDIFNHNWIISAGEEFDFSKYEKAQKNIFAFKEREFANSSCQLDDGKRYRAVPCSLCHIPKLREIGVNVFKIVGRGHDLDLKILMANLVRNVIDKKMEKQEIMERFSQSFSSHFVEMCHRGYNCYTL